MASGLWVKKNCQENASNEDAAFMKQLTILCLLGDAMDNASVNSGNSPEIASKFFEMAQQIWGFSGSALIQSTSYMANDLGYSVQFDKNVQVGHS